MRRYSGFGFWRWNFLPRLIPRLSIGFAIFGGAWVHAQIKVQVQVGGVPVVGAPSTHRWGLQLPNDEDAVAWLKRARDAAAQEDWKLAVDTLNRVMEQHGDRTVTLDSEHYYSAFRLAQQQLAEWPSDGLATYRILHDAEAARLLKTAEENHDLESLRLIARRFPMTTVGPDAIDLLAAWLIDRGEAREALELLASLEALPHRHTTDWAIYEKRAAGYVIAGQPGSAAEALAKLRAFALDKLPDVPTDFAERIEGLERFSADANSGMQRVGAAEVSYWQYRLGPASARGQMTTIEPVLSEDEEGTASLPGSERISVKKGTDLSRTRGRPPVWQAVSDGNRLFVSCPSGLVARDLATFELLWQAFPKPKMRDPRVEEHRVMVFGGGLTIVNEEDSSPRLDRDTADALYHEYSGEVSTAMGLVFTLEQDPPAEEQYPTLEGAVPPNGHLGDETLAEANTLRAYEAETGKAVWFRGRGGPPTDELRGAHFCSAPIAVGSRLVVPYRQNGDLSLAVFETDGSLVRSILIGTGRASFFPMQGILAPTLHDGTLYIQTGAGLLLAMNAHDLSLRWVTRYEPAERLRGATQGGPWWVDERFGVPQPDQWLTSPPIVAGDVVILAAHDADKLYAFDVETGVQKWSVPRAGHKYVVGADDRRVIVAGRKITAVTLADGTIEWASPRVEPTGRALVCGEQVLVPTLAGLMKLALDRGEAIGDLMETPAAMGNLFAMDGALYSVGVASISRYPDPAQTRRLALERLDANPGDLDALLRMAWLETLEEHWSDVHGFLDRAETEVNRRQSSAETPTQRAIAPNHKEHRSRLIHQRVTALIREASGADDDKRGDLLQRAADAASRGSDRVGAGLALCEYLEDVERYLDGFQRAISLLVEAGGTPMRDGPDFRVRAEVLIGDYLERIWNEMDDAARADAQEVLERLAAKNPRSLSTFADVLGFADLGRRLDLQLGVSALAAGENETGIFHFERALLRAPEKAAQLEPLLRLVIAYLSPGEGMPADVSPARRMIDELERDFRGDALPAHFAQNVQLPPDARVSDFIGVLRSSFSQALTDNDSLPRVLREASHLGLAQEVLSPSFNRDRSRDGASFWDSRYACDPAGQVVPVYLGGEIRGLNALGTGQPEWWVSNQRSPVDDAAPSVEQREARAFDAAGFGRVSVLAAPSQVCAIGMASGRSIWPPLAVDLSAGPLPQPSVIAVNDIVIAASDAQTLVAIRAREGASPLWRRSWGRSALQTLRAVAGCVVAIDRDATRVYVVEGASGRIRAEYALISEAPNVSVETVDFENPDAHVAIVDEVILRSEGNAVAGRDVLTGKPLWPPLQFEGLVRGVYELSTGYAGVAYGSDRFCLFLAASGQRIEEYDWPMVGLASPPIDVVLDMPVKKDALGGGRLLMFTRTDESPPEFVLESFPLGKSALPWRASLGPLATVSRQMMRASPAYVAVITNALPPDVDRRQRNRAPEIDPLVPPKLQIIDKATGELLGVGAYEFSEGRLGAEADADGSVLNASRRIMDVMVLNDRIIGIAPEGFFVLADQQKIKPSAGPE
ncbi:MAG TPA: PQQ-binding-like beta-propeller repeat protein [Phycisphaerae bacterium]|nr:PQQ-binding-like beta-propeller repeat protein [Phycisphaerae bacterium]